MSLDYTAALEKRLEWLRWASEDALKLYSSKMALILEQYRRGLACGDTYFMNRRFCELVDYARQTIPDDLAFDPAWMLTPVGWMWLEQPFLVPHTPALPFDVRLSAVGWAAVPEGYRNENGQPLPPGSYLLMFYLDRATVGKGEKGFGMWSYQSIMPGAKVLDRVHEFEYRTEWQSDGETYTRGRELDMLHEIRWAYTAFHLMSQKLAVTVDHTPERALRRRWEREKSPLQPFLKVVTLRRLEEARKADPLGHAVDWQWQWQVHGHWRNQWYPGEQAHKTIWIEDYVKGPTDKPLKPPTHTIFKAER